MYSVFKRVSVPSSLAMTRQNWSCTKWLQRQVVSKLLWQSDKKNRAKEDEPTLRCWHPTVSKVAIKENYPSILNHVKIHICQTDTMEMIKIIQKF